MKRQILSMIAVCFVGLCLSGCNSLPYPQKWKQFLRTQDPRWEKWLDIKVNMNLQGVPLWQFKEVPGLGFGKVKLKLCGKAANYELITLPPATLTHRELLWQIHKKYGFVIDFTLYAGDIALRVRTPEYIRLTE